MMRDKLQTSRFELKYLVNEEEAIQIREYVQCYLELDEHGVGKPNFSYPVHSLYLDSDDLKLYWATINGDKNRYKIRLRFYDDSPEQRVFFEIKRRINNAILKQRAPVPCKLVESILAGQVPDRSELAFENPKHEQALLRFVELIESIDAKPKAHVAYFREAYLPHDDNSARVTLDRAVRINPQFTDWISTEMDEPMLIWDNLVVLELKFTDRFPLWFHHMVCTFGLRQGSAAKYVGGIERFGEDWFCPRVLPASFC